MEIKDIIQSITHSADPLVADPANDNEISVCNKNLTQQGLPQLPSGFIDLLKVTNGFAWNGIELYGTQRVDSNDGSSYFLNDVISMAEYFADWNRDWNDEIRLFFGRSDEDLFSYNAQTNMYEILDLTGFDIMEEFDLFDDFFASILTGRLIFDLDENKE